MRDERQPFRFADLSLLPPIATSLFMAICGVMSKVDHGALPVLLGLHAFFLAWAAASASGRVASRVGFWVQRQAPDAALARERRQWRRTLLWAVGCGLLGPLVLAARLGDGQQWSLALWVLSETLLGAGLGALAGFAWFGMASRRALWAWPALLVGGLLLPLVWPRLLEAPWLSGLLAGLVLCAAAGASRLALRAARQTVPVWVGMRQKPGVLPDPAVRTSPKRRLGVLAFDVGPEGPERSVPQLVVYQGMAFALVVPGALVLSERELSGWLLLGQLVWQLLMFGFCGFGLVALDEHPRLRLAPQGLNQSQRVVAMLVGSAYVWLFNAALLVLMTALTLNAWDHFEMLIPLAACQTVPALMVFTAAWRRWMQRSLYGRSFRPFA